MTVTNINGKWYDYDDETGGLYEVQDPMSGQQIPIGYPVTSPPDVNTNSNLPDKGCCDLCGQGGIGQIVCRQSGLSTYSAKRLKFCVPVAP